MSELTPKENSYRSLITSIDTKKGRNYKMEIVTKKLTSSITNEKRKLTFNICDSRLFKKILKNSL
jgi:(p)ppGpp synthase/HD superfamily hydrolase